MSKVRIYINSSQIADTFRISDKATIHKIKDVLRLKQSEYIYLFDGCGKEYSYHIQKVTKKSILVKKDKLLRQSQPRLKKINLAFPLEREERVDFILQKATELGVWKFIPFTCQRSIQTKPSVNKLNRWKRIVIEASRQSQRLWVPEIEDPLSLKDVSKEAFDLKLVGKLSGRRLTKKFDKKIKNVLVIIGPVGDFSEAEYEKLETQGFYPIELSENLLRTETAAIFAVGLINNLLNES